MRKHILIMTSFVVVISAGLVAVLLNVRFTPVEASAESHQIDRLLLRLLVVAAVIFTLCLVAIIYSCVVFRRRRDGDGEDGPTWQSHGPTEIIWTLVPLVIVIIFAVYGAVVLKDITQSPPGDKELEVNVTAFQWAWSFEYPQYNITSSEIRLPVNRPVLFHLQSRDVIHAIWVPEFRVKQDAVPGMMMMMRITPDRVGDYKMYCNQLCGLGHSYMSAPVKVVEPAAFDQWVKEQRK